MTDFIVCADNSGNNDAACIDKVVEVLSNAGHNAEKAPVNSNSEELLWSGKADNKEAVFLVNGSGIYTYRSFREAVKATKCKKAWFGFPEALSPGNEWITEDGLKNKKLTDEHDAGGFKTSEATKEIMNGGKYYTAAEFFEENSEYLGWAYGKTCEDVANMILNGSPSSGGNESSDEGETQLMSGWESLCDLAKPYDGQAMLLVRGDTVVFRKIEIPEWTAIWAFEGVNVVDDSVTVKDYSPEIYNTLEIQYGQNYENILTLCFERHKELFGERKKTIQATKKVTQEEYDAYMEEINSKNENVSQPQQTPLEQPSSPDQISSGGGGGGAFGEGEPADNTASGGGGGGAMKQYYFEMQPKAKANKKNNNYPPNEGIVGAYNSLSDMAVDYYNDSLSAQMYRKSKNK